MSKEKKARIKLNAKIEAHRDEIPCLYESPDLFDPDLHGSPWSEEYKKVARIAKSFCSECPAKIECADYGFKSYATAMVWGGLTPAELGYMHRPSHQKLRPPIEERGVY